MSEVTIWDKIDPSVVRSPESSTRAAKRTGSSSSTEAVKAKRKKCRQRRRRIADIVGCLTWTYVILKLFILDLDRLLVEAYAPQLQRLLDYKFFIYLALIALVVASIRKGTIFVPYVLFWPLVVVLWKIPRLAYRLRSWNLLIAILNACYSFVHNFRWNAIIRTAEILALLGISISRSPWVVYMCLLIIFLGLLLHYYRSIKVAVQSSRFLARQQQLIERLFNNQEGLRNAVCIEDEWRGPEIEKLNKKQVREFANRVSLGITVWKSLEFYTVLLNKYRRSTAPIVFGLSAFLWLFVQSVVAFTFLNYGLGNVHPGQYDGAEQASFIRYIYYSMNSLSLNTISQLSPTGDVATALSIFAGTCGSVLLLTLLGQIVFGLKQTRDDGAFQEFFAKIHKIRRDLESQLVIDYEVSPEEAWRRLEELGIGSVSLLTRLAAKIPMPDVLDDKASRQNMMK